MSTQKRHVAPGRRGGWAVWRRGASRASRIFADETDATRYAKRLAQKEGANLYIHRWDGAVTKRYIYPGILTK